MKHNQHQVSKRRQRFPPSFGGQSSGFEFEDLIDDWVIVNITTLSTAKLGPSLKNALTGQSITRKRLTMSSFVTRETALLISNKRYVHVFFWRFMEVFRTWRGNGEFVS